MRKRWALIPTKRGIYIIFRVLTSEPVFLKESNACRHGDNYPSVGIPVLESHWVHDPSDRMKSAQVLNVGKAGGGKNRSNLRKRLRQYMKFGMGGVDARGQLKSVPHYGGRYIWQVEGHEKFLVAWLVAEQEEDPLALEGALARAFAVMYGKNPFAYLT